MRLTNEEREWLINNVTEALTRGGEYKQDYNKSHGVTQRGIAAIGVGGPTMSTKKNWKGKREDRPTYFSERGREKKREYKLNRKGYICARKEGMSHEAALKKFQLGLDK